MRGQSFGLPFLCDKIGKCWSCPHGRAFDEAFIASDRELVHAGKNEKVLLRDVFL